ncbi:MAG: c-type cytochrome [Sandaracinaceae bacterium]|nr:c-type cytochrome [Sandaracinaceae bacterium]
MKLLWPVHLGALVAALALAGGCGGEEGGGAGAAARLLPPRARRSAREARAEATQIFNTRCSVCHGAGGAGDGPGSAGLTPQPRNLTEAAWHDSVEDSYIERIIQYGGAAVGKSPAMPSNPDLGSRPEVLSALREHIRSLRR